MAVAEPIVRNKADLPPRPGKTPDVRPGSTAVRDERAKRSQFPSARTDAGRLRGCVRSRLTVAWASRSRGSGQAWPCLPTGETPVILTGRMPVLLFRHPLEAARAATWANGGGFCFIQPPASGRVCIAHRYSADGVEMVCQAHPTGFSHASL